jgi:hypothetical protein
MFKNLVSLLSGHASYFQLRETLLQRTSTLQPLDEGFSFTVSRVSSDGVTLRQISGFLVTVYTQFSACSVLCPLCYNHITCTKNQISNLHTSTGEQPFNIFIFTTNYYTRTTIIYSLQSLHQHCISFFNLILSRPLE